MHNKFNKKLLLTLSILAYGLQVSGAHASLIAEDDTPSTWSSIKNAAIYTTAGFATAVASVHAFGDKQEELVELEKQAIKGVISVGQSLWNNGTAFYKLTRGAVSDLSQWASDTYWSSYHPIVCHMASEGARLSIDAYTAVEQTISEHPYVAVGVAVTFVAAVGITHMIHKSKTNKAEQLLAKEKKKIAKIQQKLQEAKQEALKAKQEALKATRFATKAADKLVELQEAQKTVGPTVVSPTTTIKPQTNIKPDVTIDGHNTSSPRARAVGGGGGQGGNVTFNLVLPGTPETLSGFLPSMLHGKTTTPLILGNTAIKAEG